MMSKAFDAIQNIDVGIEILLFYFGRNIKILVLDFGK